MGIFSRLAAVFRGPRQLPPEGERSLRRQLSPATYAKSDWLLADLEDAVRSADAGSMALAAKLAAACRRDGTISGVLGTRTKGLLSLPRYITAPDPKASEAFAADFDAMFPIPELEQILGDGILLGVGVGEFVQPAWSRLPVLRRLDPERLTYRWSEDRWYYSSATGLLPITPGDGRWFLHRPCGHVNPWRAGAWAALGRAFIAKQSAFYSRENYANKLANAARCVTTPSGATNEDRAGFLADVVDWGPNASFELPPGYDLKLIESNGKGHEVFTDIMEKSDLEAVVALSGQTVTMDGGAGFQNGAIFQAIRLDLVQGDALALASTIIEQGAFLWGYLHGVDGLQIGLRWETTPPKDRNLEATASMQAANAAKAWRDLGVDVDADELARRYGIPIRAGVLPPIVIESSPGEEADDAVTSVLFEDDAAEQLAKKMTDYGVERCQHGNVNRCPRCGIERVRDFDVMPDGSHQWRIAWRAIPKLPPATEPQ